MKQNVFFVSGIDTNIGNSGLFLFPGVWLLVSLGEYTHVEHTLYSVYEEIFLFTYLPLIIPDR